MTAQITAGREISPPFNRPEIRKKEREMKPQQKRSLYKLLVNMRDSNMRNKFPPYARESEVTHLGIEVPHRFYIHERGRICTL